MINRYTQLAQPEGYLYVIIQNKDPEATYKESFEFDEFEDLKMLSPHSGKSFEFSVGPCMTEIVLIKAMRGAHFVPGKQRLQILHGNFALKQICLK